MKRTVKIAKKKVEDKQLIDLFNQMTGVSAPDPAIILPKYEDLLKQIKLVLKILKLLVTCPFRKVFPKQEGGFAEIEKYVSDMEHVVSGFALDEREISDKKPANIEEYIRQQTKCKYDPAKLCDTYMTMKSCDFVKQMIVLCGTLSVHKKYICDKEKLSAKFIHDTPGLSLQLFKFSNIDLKQMFENEYCDANCQKFFLSILHHLHKHTHKIRDIIVSPDIDVDQFSQLLVENIGAVKKQIPRCDKAFDKILNSVDLLKDNFGKYYKDMVQSNDPGTIIQSFITDVAGSVKSDLSTLSQFKTIINYYRKKSATVKSTNPQLAKMFNMIDSTVAEAEEEEKKNAKKKDN